MKELVIISGKGGSGKTTLTAAFAALAENMVLCDADVDASDLHLIMQPEVKEDHPFMAGHTASIRKADCTGCGKCIEMCRFNAISDDYVVDPLDCEGCGVCVYFCDAGAIDFPENQSGNWYISETRFGPMVHARLGIAEENSGKLVTKVRQTAAQIAKENGNGLLLTDGPPGVGCPVIASIGGAAAVLIVTEPSLSGRHDMERVGQLAAHFKIPAMVCINKYDLNPEQAEMIETYAGENNLSVVGRIPFDPLFTRAMVEKQTVFEYDADAAVNREVKVLWERVCRQLGI